MNKLAITQFGILAIVSGFMAGLTFYTGRCAAYHWYECFYDSQIGPPDGTAYAARYGFVIPLACCLTSICCIIVSMRKTEAFDRLWNVFTLIVAVELIGLGLVALLYFQPTFTIMYRLM